MPKEKDNIVITKVKIPDEEKKSFVQWESKLNSIIADFPGFLSLEVLASNEAKCTWSLIQRFSDASHALKWMNSEKRKELFKELKAIVQEPYEDFFSQEAFFNGVTEVIITEVTPEKESYYRDWLAKIHKAEAQLQGFRGMYVQTPLKGKGMHWITFLQFDKTENLDKWLISDQRQQLLKELDPMIKNIESHRVITSYGGWFNSIAKTGTIPPTWKQTMLVLLVLFPIVMLEIKYLSPLTKKLDISLATFIGNALSVILISWPMMPIAIYCFQRWLNPQAFYLKKTNIIGTLVLIGLYLLEILIFYHFI